MYQSPSDPFKELHAPVHYLDTLEGVELWIKREDQIHPEVSGNKWRKLKYYLKEYDQSGANCLLTFGGAFSNHLAATAALGKMVGIPTKALVRGEELLSNPTLDFCSRMGMEWEGISRKRYAAKDDPEFEQLLRLTLPGVYLIPEGGKGPLGVHGCSEILDELEGEFDGICVSAGTATTAAGLALHPNTKALYVYSALKGNGMMLPAIAKQISEYQRHFSTEVHGQKSHHARIRVREMYHFGGYAKVNAELVDFLNKTYAHYGLPLDPVYTGKLLFGVLSDIKSGYYPAGSRLLLIHTGGLQGIAGMNRRLESSGLHIDYES